MKKIGIGIFLFAILCGALQAQVTVEVTADQEQFLPGEDLPVAVRITNRTGRTLRLGASDDWLTFSIEGQDGPSDIVSRTGDVPVAGEFDLESSKVAIKRVNLAPYFSLNKQGRYGVIATLHIPNAGAVEIVSNPKLFYVVEGARIWEREFGIPAADGGASEIRKYVLQQSSQAKGQLRLYLRVTDASGSKTLKIFPIGTLLSFSRPNPQLDRDSNLHLLFQSGPTTFSYTVFNPNGDLVIRQTHDFLNNSRPRLLSDAEGNIRVKGGMRRESLKDFPPKIEAAATESVKPAATPDETSNQKP